MTSRMAKDGKQMTVKVKKIEQPAALEQAHKIRHEVFVVEQHVPAEAELDAFESSSQHFIAYDEHGHAVGTARWRYTDEGIKLERFAVKKDHRGKGVGRRLVEAVLDDILSHSDYRDQTLYLHSQVEVCLFYAGFGFRKMGEMFEECGIQHYKMILDHRR